MESAELLFNYTYEEHNQKNFFTRLEEERARNVHRIIDKAEWYRRIVVETADGGAVAPPFNCEIDKKAFPLEVRFLEPDASLQHSSSTSLGDFESPVLPAAPAEILHATSAGEFPSASDIPTCEENQKTEGKDIGLRRLNSRVDNVKREVATLMSGASNVNRASFETVKELLLFKEFLRQKYPTANKAFDELIGYDPQLRKDRFLSCLEERRYSGNSVRLFQALAGSSDFIEKETFKQCLVAVANVQLPDKKRCSFGNVELHAVRSTKDHEGQGWDLLPPAILPLEGENQGPMPTGLDFFQIMAFSRPAAQSQLEDIEPDLMIGRMQFSEPARPDAEVTGAKCQPAASGQPSRRQPGAMLSQLAADAAQRGRRHSH